MAVDEEYEVLVLDRDARLGACMAAEAREPRLADREAAAEFAPDVGDLAGEPEARARRLYEPVDDVLPLCARCENGPPDLERLTSACREPRLS